MKIALDLRVLSIPEKKSRGSGRVITDLVNALGSVASEEEFIIILASEQEFKRPSERFLSVTLPWKYGDISRGDWWSESRRTGAFLRELSPDLYHAPDLYIPRGWNGPIVVTVHDYFPLPLFGPVRLFGRTYGTRWNFRFRFRYHWTWRSLRRAAVIAANSENTARQVRNAHPALAPKIRAIPWGIDAFWFDKPDHTESILKKYDLTRPLLLHVGGLESRKNPDGVLGSFETIHAERPSATLALAGPPFGARPNMPGVRVLGRVSDEDLRALYHAADCLLFPSFEEGFGVPIVEALAAGCPVVTSRGTATEETAAGYARLVDPYRPDEIVAAARAALEAPRPAPIRTVATADDTARAYLDAYHKAVR